jgi:hypothetical protein
MTRTLQERPGLHGRARHDPLDNREHVIGACAKLADALLRGRASAGHPQAGTIRASRRPRRMYAHEDQDSTSALTPSLPSHRSRAAAFARDSRHSGQVARAVRGARCSGCDGWSRTRLRTTPQAG